MNRFLRNWREAEWSVRIVYFVLAAETGFAVFIAAVLWLGS